MVRRDFGALVLARGTSPKDQPEYAYKKNLVWIGQALKHRDLQYKL